MQSQFLVYSECEENEGIEQENDDRVESRGQTNTIILTDVNAIIKDLEEIEADQNNGDTLVESKGPKKLSKNQRKRLKKKLAKQQQEVVVVPRIKAAVNVADEPKGTPRIPIELKGNMKKVKRVDREKILIRTETTKVQDEENDYEVAVETGVNENLDVCKSIFNLSERPTVESVLDKKKEVEERCCPLPTPPFVRHRLKPRGSDPHLLSSYCKNGNVADDEYLYTRPPHHYLTYRRKFPNEFKTAGPKETFLLPFTMYIKSDNERSESSQRYDSNILQPISNRFLTPRSINSKSDDENSALRMGPTLDLNSQTISESPRNSEQRSQNEGDKNMLTTVMTIKGPIELK